MANGKFGGGTGTPASPYLIEDIADLDAIRTNNSLYFKLTKSLNMNNSTFLDATKGWNPIQNFAGNFDGNYHNIRGLKINITDSTNYKGVGLFANVNANAVIKNLGLIDVDIQGLDMTGSLIGYIAGDNVIVDYCYVVGKVSGTRDVGGLIGQSRNKNSVQLSNIFSECSVTGTADNVGGAVGEFSSLKDDTKYKSSAKNIFVYGSAKGDNFITTNAVFGHTDTLTIFNGCYYDKGNVSTNYPDENAQGVDKAYFYNNANFKDLIPVLMKDYTGINRPLWVFSTNDYIRMSFYNRKISLFKIDNVYNYYDSVNKVFTPVGGTVTYNTFLEKGIEDVSIIPQSLLHDTMKSHTFNIFVMFDSSKSNSLYPSLQLVTDAERTTKSLLLSTIEPNHIITNDFNPVNANAMIDYMKNGIEVTNYPLQVSQEAIATTNYAVENDVKINYDTKKIDDSAVEVTVQRNSLPTDSTVTSAFVDDRTIEIHSSKESEYTGVNVTVGQESNVSFGKYDKVDRKVYSDKKQLKANVKGNVFYTMCNTITAQNRGVHVNAEGENKSRYLMSVSNGKDWLRYNNDTNTWVSADLANIYDEGMTLDQMNSRSVMNSLPTTYKSKIKYAASISSEAFNTSFHIKDINIEFEPNEAPQILESGVSTDDAQVTVSGTVFDAENDKIKYRILTKYQIDTEWTQLLPTTQDAWFSQNNNYQFKHSFPISSFKNGSNAIKIQTMDVRGATYEKILSFTLIEGTPEVKINDNNQFYANITLKHSQAKKVHYKILINGEQKAPLQGWTEWKTTPYTFDYTWNTEDVLNGLPNEIEIIVEDEMQSQTFAKFNIIGEYKSLLFKDEDNFYYSTDTGEMLQQLDFGTIVGGVLSNVYPVWLENKTGLPMENINIFADSTTQENLSKIKVSFTDNEFVPAESIVYDKIMENNDVVKFYVRIESDEKVQSLKNKVFKVLAKGDPIDTTIVNPLITKDTYATLKTTYNPLKDGFGLYNVKVNNLTDTIGINNMNIFVAYDKVYITSPAKVTKEEFVKAPISDGLRTADYNTYLALHADYQVYSIDWLNDFFMAQFNDTFDNLKAQKKITYDTKVEYCASYDGHEAWIKSKDGNDKIKFSHTWQKINM